jgi:hypothetical protein
MVPLKYHTTHKDKWSINKLMTICVKKKGRLVMELEESATLAMWGEGQDSN